MRVCNGAVILEKLTIVSCHVAMFEAKLTTKSLSNSFLLVNMANLNELRNLPGELFRPQMKFSIPWIPIEITGFQLRKFVKQQSVEHP